MLKMSIHDQEIKFTHDDHSLSLKCNNVADGVMVTFQQDKVTHNRIVTDENITGYIGSAIYCAFNYAVQQLNEPVNSTDFNFNIICTDIPQDQIKAAWEHISSLIPHGARVIDVWRNIKHTLSTCSVLISEYDWSRHSGMTSDALAHKSTNVKEYFDDCLNEIADNSDNMTYRKAARHIKNQIDGFGNILTKQTHVTCYGVTPPKCENCNACYNNFEEITWGPALFWFLVVVLVILLIWFWFSTLR